RSSLDLVLDLHHEPREACVAMTASDDVERLQQRHAGLEHRGELAREKRDVLVADLASAAIGLPLDLQNADTLPAQVGRDDGLRCAARFAAHRLVATVDAFPDEQRFLDSRILARSD